jgi:hypothetical protein
VEVYKASLTGLQRWLLGNTVNVCVLWLCDIDGDNDVGFISGMFENTTAYQEGNVSSVHVKGILLKIGI